MEKYMRKLSEDEIKKLSILMLKDIKQVCSKLKLTYFLDSGSLLGAIRHDGFIPWDDDIDIAMPRPDYEVFIKQYNEHCAERYKIKTIENSLSFIYPWAKVYDKTTKLYEHGKNYCNLGLSIDIFPIDAYPNSDNEKRAHWETITRMFSAYASEEYYFFNHYSFNPRHLKKNFHIFLSKNGLFRKKAKSVVQIAKSINWNNALNAGVNVCCYYRNRARYVSKDCFTPIEHIFEGEMFSIPKGYDSILKSYYGDDYMIPPPVDKRLSTHALEIFQK